MSIFSLVIINLEIDTRLVLCSNTESIRELSISRRNTNTFILILIVTCVILFSVISVVDFKNLVRLKIPATQNKHRLGLNEVLENENRRRIVEEISNEPGIHYNELRRNVI